MGVSLEQTTDRNLALRYDEVDANTAYLGLAPINSANSASVWQIKKLDYTTGVDVRWANGNQGFSNVWDNRASLTYT